MSDIVPTLVINVADVTHRREFQAEQLARLGLPAEFLNAITPQDIPPHILKQRMHSWARPLRPTEVACLLSHRAAWERTIQNGVPTLILEDDAVLSDDLPKVLGYLGRMTGVHYVNVEALNHKKVLSRQRQPVPKSRFSLSLLVRNRGGAGAYLLWPDGAKLLLAYTEKLSPLADSALMLSPGIVCLQLEPAASTQAFLVAQPQPDDAERNSSTLVGARPDYGGAFAMLAGKFLRLRISVRLARRLLRNIGRTDNRIVGFDTDRMVMSPDRIADL